MEQYHEEGFPFRQEVADRITVMSINTELTVRKIILEKQMYGGSRRRK